MFFVKRVLNSIINRFLNYFFYKNPRYGLRILFYLKLDIYLYSLPMFLFTNYHQLKRLYKIKSRNIKTNIILWNNETDGRFDRISKISELKNDDQSVWFKFPTQVTIAEHLIFASYNIKGCGFYEDARQKYNSPDNYQNRINYRIHLRKLFKTLEFFIGKINFFLSGSNNDRYVVELIYTLQEMGASCIVCEREGTGTDFTYKYEAECFKNSESIQAHYIYTANEKHKFMFDFAKLPTVKEVKVLGELDTDFWFHWDRKFTHKFYKKWDKFNKKVLFLTFGVRNYIEPYLYPQYPDLNWNKLLSDSEEVIFQFAKNNPSILVFYKMGHIEDHNEEFIKKCQNNNLNNIVTLDRSFPCNELILYSDLIIGFQTTAMFEAMFSDKTIFYLYWAISDILDRKTQLLPIADSEACTVINSKEDFYNSITSWSNGDIKFAKPSQKELNNRKITREIMFYNADGNVAERYHNEINEIIESKANL